MMDDDNSLAVMTVTKLILSAEHYASVNPALSRFYMVEAERLKKKLHLPMSSSSQICPYCCTVRRPGNCSRRLLSKMKTSQNIRRLGRKNSKGQQVGKFGNTLLRLQLDGANRLLIRCRSCRKRSLLRGACRPTKIPKSRDMSVGRNSEVQTRKKKNKKRKKCHVAEENSASSDIPSVGKEVKEKQQNETTVRPQFLKRRKVTNKKEALKQRHSMLQNILKLKSSHPTSSDSSAALKSFLVSL